MNVDTNLIPGEMRERRHWVCWKEEQRGDKLTKIPKQPDGSGANAKSNDSATWGSFEEAVETAASREDWGIGFVFTANDPFTGIDLDDCLTEQGAGPQDWLPSIEDIFANETYIERSPSGGGLHVIVKNASVPEWWTNQKVDAREVAVFEAGKFFTFTGDAIDVSTSTVAEVDALDEWLLEAHEALTGELPTETHSEPDEGSSLSGDLELRDVISSSEFEEGKRAPHPFHSSSTGSNFMVEDWSAGYWNCYSAGCPGGRNGITGGNAAQLLGVKLEVWDCGEWHHGGLSKEQWREFYKEAREAGYEVGEEKPVSPSHASNEEAQEAARAGSAGWETIRSFYDQSDIENKHARQAAAARLNEEYHFATPMDTKVLWIYNPETGVYEQAKDSHVKLERLLARSLGPHFSQHEKREILGKIKADSAITRDEFDGDDSDRLLCVANGVLDLETREKREHSPDDLFTRGLPVEYDETASADGIEAFLEDVVDTEDEQQTLLEMLGATLWPTYLKGKFAIYFGEGANGKSTWFDVQEALLGEDHVSGWDLQNLSENRFTTADLVGKFANIAPDMPSTKIQQMGTLKTLTGRDTRMAERKGEQAFEFVNRATLLFGANRPPALPETSHAVARRLVPIRFPNKFTDAKGDGNPDARDKDEYLEELTTDSELSGLLNLALDGLDRLRANGDVSLAKSFEERLEYYEQFSDPVKEFRVRCMENASGHRVKKATVYEAFKNFCAENDYTVRDVRTFWKVLKQSTLTVDEGRPLIDGSQEYVLRGARFTEVGARYAPSSMTLPEAFADMDTPSDESDDEKEADRAAFEDVVALNDLEPADGWTTLTVEVVSLETNHGEKGPALRGSFRDRTDLIDFIDFDGRSKLDVLEEGGCYRISGVRLEVSEKYGPQLKFHDADAVVEVNEIQQGAGTTPPADSDGSERLGGDAAADGGTVAEESANLEQADVVPRAVMYVREHGPDQQKGVSHEDVVEHLVDEGATDGLAEWAIKNLLEKHEIHEPAEEGFYKPG